MLAEPPRGSQAERAWSPRVLDFPLFSRGLFLCSTRSWHSWLRPWALPAGQDEDGIRHPGDPDLQSGQSRPLPCPGLTVHPLPSLGPPHLLFPLSGTASLLCWPHQLFTLQCGGHLLREAHRVVCPPQLLNPGTELSWVPVPLLRWATLSVSLTTQAWAS